MFAYCGNNLVNRIDVSGYLWVGLAILAGTALLTFFCTSSEDTSQNSKQEAKENYNSDTVFVYERGNPPDKKGAVNAEVYYPTAGVSNINVDNSLNIRSNYEQEAVLDVIIESPYYSEAVYGDKDFMQAQWIAHNMCYDIASSGDIGFGVMQRFSGSEDPIQSSLSLDLRSLNNVGRRQKAFYTIISWIC